MTPETCANGTERCAAAHDALGTGHEIVVNLQGDAPLTPPWFVSDLVAGLRGDAQAEVATPVLRCDGRALNSFLADRAEGASAAPRPFSTVRAGRSTSPRR